MSEPSFEEKITYVLLECAKDAGFGKWEGKEFVPMVELEEAMEKFSNKLIEKLKEAFGG